MPVSPTPRPLYPCRKECEFPIKQAVMWTAQPVRVICKREHLLSPAGVRTPNRQARTVATTVRRAGDEYKNDALSCNVQMCTITHTRLSQTQHNIRCGNETNKCIQTFNSVLYTRYDCYMFRPHLWTFSARCITNDILHKRIEPMHFFKRL